MIGVEIEGVVLSYPTPSSPNPPSPDHRQTLHGILWSRPDSNIVSGRTDPARQPEKKKMKNACNDSSVKKCPQQSKFHNGWFIPQQSVWIQQIDFSHGWKPYMVHSWHVWGQLIPPQQWLGMISWHPVRRCCWFHIPTPVQPTNPNLYSIIFAVLSCCFKAVNLTWTIPQQLANCCISRPQHQSGSSNWQ